MKKLLTGILALLTCFTCGTAIACGETGDNGGATSDLAGAKDYLYGMYSDRDTAVRKDYEVVNVVVYDDVSYNVTWAVSGADSVSVKPGKSAEYSLIDVDETKTEEVSYTLTATITDANGNTVTVSFDRVVSALVGDSVMAPQEKVAYNMYIEQMTLKENLLLTGKMDSDNKYYEMTTDNAEAASVYAEVVEGGYKFYVLGENDAKSYLTLTERYREDKDRWAADVSYSATGSVFYFDAVGVWACALENETFFLGTYGSYETTSASTSYYMKAENIGVSQYPLLLALPGAIQGGAHEGAPVVEEPEADTVLTIAEALELANELQRDTKGKYYITGEITEIYNEEYGNMYIKDAQGNTIQVYGSYDADGKNRFDAMTTKPAVGDTVKLYTIVSYFNNPQLKNAWIVEITAGSGNQGGTETPDTPDTPDTPVVDGDPLASEMVTAPVAETAYNFYMYQGNAKKVVYLKGGMSSYYLATSENVADAITVKLEETTGGYYLYCMVNDVKTYINMVASGNFVNGAYETTASTVYTWNAEYNTLVNADGYFFGTRGDNTYTTVGPCAASYIAENFVMHFVAADENQGGETGGTETPVEPPATEDPILENTAYKFYVNQVNIGTELYITGEVSGRYLSTTMNASEGVDVYAEKVAGGYKFYILVDSAKQYINLYLNSSSKESVNFAADSTTVFAYDDSLDIWTTTLNGTAYYLGTYNDFNTISASKTSFINSDNNGVSQFPARFATADEAAAMMPTVADKLAHELSKLSVDATIKGAKEITLASQAVLFTDVTIEWVITAGADIATITDNKLSIVNPTDETTVTVKATVSIGDDSESKTFDILVSHLSEDVTLATETFAIAASAGTMGTKEITWNSTNFTFVGKQASSSNAIRTQDTDHYRVYQGSTFSITGKDGAMITQVVITVTESKYAQPLIDSLTTAGITATANGTTVTLTVDSGSVSSIDFTATAQFRVKSFEITYMK